MDLVFVDILQTIVKYLVPECSYSFYLLFIQRLKDSLMLHSFRWHLCKEFPV